MDILHFNIEENVDGWTVSNGQMSFSAMNFGCTIMNLFVPDKNGEKTDVLLGFDTFSGWKNGTQAHNAIVGRFANRIAGGKFFLDGKNYVLDVNNGKNCLHGGFFRYEKQIWQAEPFLTDDNAGIVFTRLSRDGEQNFPGNLELKVIYSLNSKNQLVLEYFAKTDKPTPINLTNHAYFNLNGCKGENILNHTVCLDCQQILKVDEMIPTGEFLDVCKDENSVFNFLEPKLVGKDLEKLQKMTGMRGYDHCFVTKADEKNVEKAGWCKSEKSGIKMNIYTNQRGIQFYTGNYLENFTGKSGVLQKPFDGLCFEAQRFPDCMNHKNFPDCILRSGEEYYQKTIYEFLTEKC